MGKVIWMSIIAIAVCLMFFSISDPPLQEKVAETYYVTNRGRHYWNKFKQPALRLRSYFFPHPDLPQERNFVVHQNRGYEGGDEEAKRRTAEAVDKSLERTKSTLEDSAKLAAEMTGEAAYKTAGVVKDTLSKGSLLSSDVQDEL